MPAPHLDKCFRLQTGELFARQHAPLLLQNLTGLLSGTSLADRILLGGQTPSRTMAKTVASSLGASQYEES